MRLAKGTHFWMPFLLFSVSYYNESLLIGYTLFFFTAVA